MNAPIFYLAGPGDIIGTYRHWRAGRDDPSQVAVTYSGQFFDVCRTLGRPGLAVAYRDQSDRVADDGFEVIHRRIPMQTWRGPFFHLGWYLFILSLVWTAWRRGADTMVLMTGTHLLPLWVAKLLGIKVILSGQCVLWPKNLGKRGLWKVVHALDRGFYRRGADGLISISADITRQIDELTGGSHASIIAFRPHYRREEFDEIPDADPSVHPFRVLFAGRVEENKGIFDVVEIADRLRKESIEPISFDIAGDGGALAETRRRIAKRNLQSNIHTYGYCEKPRMRQLLHACHMVIIPTKAEMIEGFNKVVAESVLSGRPYVTSNLCPAIEYVRDSGIEVHPDQIDEYVWAIKKLVEDRLLYAKYVQATRKQREQFLDPEQSWASALERVLSTIGVDRPDKPPRRPAHLAAKTSS